MVFESIEKLKQDFTDKYVVVDASRPELRRFNGMTGVIKTVNMNGRALVQFDGNANVAWYDIDLDFLNVVDKPIVKEAAEKPKAVAKPAEAKAPAAKTAAPAAAKAVPGKAGGMSMADILAAARGGGAAPAAAKPAEPKAEAPAAPKAAPAKPGGMSIQEILAAARGNAPTAGPKPTATPAPAAEKAATPAEPPAPAAKPESKTEKPASPSVSKGDLPKDVAGILAFCRQRDA